MSVKVVNFGEKVGPMQLLEDAAKKHWDAKGVVVVVLDRDERIGVGHTDCSNTEILGMLDLAKDSIIRGMED